MSAPVLAYVEECLPAPTREARVALAAREGLALELGYTGPAEDALLRALSVPIVTLTALRLHDVHALHPDPVRRQQGAAHLAATIEAAAAAGVPRVLAVCGFGRTVCSQPFESCRAFFAAAAPLARARGVRILLELLSPARAAALTDPAEFSALVAALQAPDVFATALDTGHLLDGGRAPLAVLASWPHPIEELQLRGKGSTPPPPELSLRGLLAQLPRPPAVVAVEHRTSIDEDDFVRLVARLRRELDEYARA